MSNQPNNSHRSPFAPLAVGFLIGGVTVSAVALVWKHDAPPRSRPSIPTYTMSPSAAASPSALESAVTRVAAKFACSCGTCGEKRLDVCSCETAQAERAFIQEQLRNGRTEAEAADALNQKYGGLKS